MPTRAAYYIGAYSKHMSAASRWASIQDTIKDEAKRYELEQKMVTDLAATVADLEESFRVKQSNDMIGAQMLAEEFKAERAIHEGETRAKVQQEIAAEVPANIRDAPDAAAAFARAVQDQAGYTPSRVSSVRAELVRKGATKDQLSQYDARTAAVKDRKKDPEGPKWDETKLAKYKVIFDVLGNQNEFGYVGGVEGKVRAQERSPEDSKRLAIYIQALEDGNPTAEEFGGDKAELALAKAVYDRAKAEGSYTRGQRKYFEPTWIDAQKRLKEAEARAAKLGESGAIQSPQQEAARRELLARGLKEEDFKYAGIFGTPQFDYVKAADRLYEEGKAQEGGRLTALTSEQQQIEALLDQFEASGRGWDTKTLERQLKKLVPPDQLADAVGFALAIDRQRQEGTGAKPKDQAAIEKQIKADQARREGLVEKVRADVAKAQAEVAGVEAKVAEVVSKVRAESEAVKAEEKAHIAERARDAEEAARMVAAKKAEARARMAAWDKSDEAMSQEDVAKAEASLDKMFRERLVTEERNAKLKAKQEEDAKLRALGLQPLGPERPKKTLNLDEPDAQIQDSSQPTPATAPILESGGPRGPKKTKQVWNPQTQSFETVEVP